MTEFQERRIKDSLRSRAFQNAATANVLIFQKGRMTTGSTRPPSPSPETKRHGGVLGQLGPGLITGAADDDPSGIATYSQVGVQFGLDLLWTMLFSFPLMTAVQEICARLGRITGVGIAASMSKRFPKPLVTVLVCLLCAANVFNLGADIAAMGASAELLAGRGSLLFSVGFGTVSLVLQVFVPYRKYVKFLKWLTLVLFAYVLTVLLVHIPLKRVLHATVIPSIRLERSYWTALVAVLGTTISPYLFFWQASQETEELRAHKSEAPLKWTPWKAAKQFGRIATDTRVGMAFSNLVAFSIILATAVTLHDRAGQAHILTAADAASALKPVAGRFAFALFATGIIGTGLLAVPVLAGSAAYAVADVFHWRASLRSKPHQAPQFYAVISIATLLGVGLTLFRVDAIKALYWSAVLNGLSSAPLMIALMKLADDSKTVQHFRLPWRLRALGWGATATMLAASLLFLYSSIFS